MKVFILSCVTAIVVAIGAYAVLNTLPTSSSVAYASKTGVRL